MLKLYDYPGAPNPRRVKIFLAEKGIEYETVHCDITKLEQKQDAFLKMNPSGKIPVLELEDGRHLGESVAICRYLEAICPAPNLFGEDPFELGHIEMRNRQIELELWSQVGTSWVNGPIVSRAGRFTPNLAAKEASDRNVRNYYERLNMELSASPYIAGERFTVADITLVTAIDFAGSLVNLKPEESLAQLWHWHARVSARPSVSAS